MTNQMLDGLDRLIPMAACWLQYWRVGEQCSGGSIFEAKRRLCVVNFRARSGLTSKVADGARFRDLSRVTIDSVFDKQSSRNQIRLRSQRFPGPKKQLRVSIFSPPQSIPTIDCSQRCNLAADPRVGPGCRLSALGIYRI